MYQTFYIRTNNIACNTQPTWYVLRLLLQYTFQLLFTKLTFCHIIFFYIFALSKRKHYGTEKNKKESSQKQAATKKEIQVHQGL